MENGRWSVAAGPKVRAKTLEERLNSCCRGATTKEFDFYIVFETGSIGRGSGGGANRLIRESKRPAQNKFINE